VEQVLIIHLLTQAVLGQVETFKLMAEVQEVLLVLAVAVLDRNSEQAETLMLVLIQAAAALAAGIHL
jgi:hypothetical protein